jgi:hypothetical protein
VGARLHFEDVVGEPVGEFFDQCSSPPYFRGAMQVCIIGGRCLPGE